MKNIVITDNIKEQILEKFKIYLEDARLSSGRIDYSYNINNTVSNEEKATIVISSKAYLKMMLYIRDTSSEIAWHGTVNRDKTTNTYTIKDVFLYPQMLTSATVKTDQKAYEEWLESLDDETFNTMRMQGHSHVNFGAGPSGTDYDYYNDILQTLPNDEYYIFMIMNKAGNTTWLIYDLDKNLIYENNDIDVVIEDNTQNFDLFTAIEEEKKKFCKTTYTYSGYGSYCDEPMPRHRFDDDEEEDMETLYDKYKRAGIPATLATYDKREQLKAYNAYKNKGKQTKGAKKK